MRTSGIHFGKDTWGMSFPNKESWGKVKTTADWANVNRGLGKLPQQNPRRYLEETSHAHGALRWIAAYGRPMKSGFLSGNLKPEQDGNCYGWSMQLTNTFG